MGRKDTIRTLMQEPLRLRFTTFGDWKKGMDMVKELEPDIYKGYLYGQEKALKKLAKLVKGHINSQSGVPGLGVPKYYTSGSTKNLVDTGSYLSSITTWRESFTYYVGVKAGLYEPKSKVRIALVAYWLEYGNKRIKGIPVWRTSLAELGGIKGINKIVSQAIETRLKNRGW